MDKYNSLKLNPHMIVAVAVRTEVVSIVSGDSFFLQEVVIGLGVLTDSLLLLDRKVKASGLPCFAPYLNQGGHCHSKFHSWMLS